MYITLSLPRDLLLVPSIRCQSLLGKAIQEHFTKPDQVASVFSSSPSLRNSSAGANFLSNFEIYSESLTLFRTVFTPEDCFALQFAPKMNVCAESFVENLWRDVFSFVQQLIKTRYFEASLRSLKIVSKMITDEQLYFIFSHLRRLTTLELNFHANWIITSEGLSSSIGNLLDLTELTIENSDSVNMSRKYFGNSRKLLEGDG
jgi:hypothetical protein